LDRRRNDYQDGIKDCPDPPSESGNENIGENDLRDAGCEERAKEQRGFSREAALRQERLRAVSGRINSGFYDKKSVRELIADALLNKTRVCRQP
jgi:hypothetical protein